ncbi:polysaccharide biosynthesis protein, partial [Pseudomonas aeruginosa]|uniref:polysaccharide biosynthesis protein n=1 Tax=Pseudomonas aeruginosa TaxID=287 RepID=UPI001F08DB36
RPQRSTLMRSSAASDVYKRQVYPINAMGISKAMMEKVMVAKSRNLETTSTVICGTRYGNVMASRGSVIPLFIEQMRSGKPLTITD